jgi:hypothetical protein
MSGTLLLDCEGLSKLYLQDRLVLTFVAAAQSEGARVGTTAMTRLEAELGSVHRSRIAWTLSRIDVHEITRAVSDAAADLLRAHDVHGHKYAIDAALAAIARASRPPVTLMTSDPGDLTLLCGKGIRIVKV